jgi:two-component system, OmpR family, osmolarity sensor histidine kinase EnvZ
MGGGKGLCWESSGAGNQGFGGGQVFDHEQISGLQINDMGQNVAHGGGQQGACDVGVDAGGQGGERQGGGAECGKNGGLAGPAVGDKLRKAGGHVGDGITMTGVGDGPVPCLKARERGHVGGHITIGRRNERGGPAHHMITGKQDVCHGKAEVVGGMAGGVQGLHMPVVAGNDIAVGKVDLGYKTVVDAFAPIRQRGGRGVGPEPNGGGACHLCQTRGEGGMVEVGMGDEDMGDDLCRFQRRDDLREMRVEQWPGVEHGHAASPEDVGVGARAGHRPRIRGEEAADHGADLVQQGAFPARGGQARLPRMFKRLKIFWPRGLYGRAALILIVPIVTIQLVVSTAFIQRHYEDVTRQMTDGVVVELDLVLADLAQGKGVALADSLGIGVQVPAPAPPLADTHIWWDLSARIVIDTLHERMPAVQVVDAATVRREVRVWVQTADGLVGLVVGRNRMSASNPHQLLVLMIVTSILMTFIAFVFLRNQLLPIQRLARAAEAFGKGQVVAYRPRGALEVRAAGMAFLDMKNRIERQIDQRTLMLSGVSHDLRTPLTRLRLGLAMLPDDEETKALQRDVADMERMVDEFLSFARGDATEDATPVDVVALVRRAVEDAVRGGQVVQLGEVDGGGLVALRPMAVRRALDNLIGNAVRYGTRAVVSVAITERAVRLTVEDDGPGIPRARRDEAMAPFARLDAARNPNRGGGAGLGLTIAADIARSHGGTLRLGDSDIGGLKAELVLAR